MRRIARGLAHELVHGLPFFEMNDRRYLLLNEQGQVVCAEVELRVVASSFEEFMYRIIREPFFYDDDVDDE